jgi:hypothetical protein
MSTAHPTTHTEPCHAIQPDHRSRAVLPHRQLRTPATVQHFDETRPMGVTAASFAIGAVLLHVRSGRRYEVLWGPGQCCIEAGRTPAYAYRLHGPAGLADPMVWIRPAAEMEDGRFVPAPGGACDGES